jgi:aminoglycoside/choline kinase family phosphotransferase
MVLPQNSGPPFSEHLKRHIESELQLGKVDITWLAGDGSDRLYYRIIPCRHPESSYVLMLLSGSDSEALKRGQYEWSSIGKLLSNRKIRTPKIISTLTADSALIIEDYGDIMLETKVSSLIKENAANDIKNLYLDCFRILSSLLKIEASQSVESSTWYSRSFDVEKFTWELNFFLKKFLFNVAEIQLSKSEFDLFQNESKKISEYLASYSKYFVHRDLHSRNLMCLNNDIAIIDFQDARLGPPSYDLVSLVFDSYVPFNAAFRSELLQTGVEIIKNDGHVDISKEILSTWKPMLLQRQLKAIGSFGYLTKDKNKGDYLKYVSPALKTLEDQNIADERWPFISSVLLRKIRYYLDN